MKALGLALLLAVPAMAGQPSKPAAVMSSDDQTAVRRALDRGALIYAYDQAAWHGTDDMRAKLPDYAALAGGWVVEGTADAPHLLFFDKGGTAGVYAAQFAHGRLIESKVLTANEDRRLTPDELRLIAALRTARTALQADRTVFACSDKPFNSVVLPPETPGGPIAVYFLTPQTTNDAVPGGGHYRVEVDANGRAGPVRAFTKACAPLSTRSPAGEGRTAAMMITHLLDPVPTEVHVFTSLTSRLPLYVVTTSPSQRLWAVEGDRIRLINAEASLR